MCCGQIWQSMCGFKGEALEDIDDRWGVLGGNGHGSIALDGASCVEVVLG